jgi:hypothetical protein
MAGTENPRCGACRYNVAAECIAKHVDYTDSGPVERPIVFDFAWGEVNRAQALRHIWTYYCRGRKFESSLPEIELDDYTR